jgi:hypothetical protein
MSVFPRICDKKSKERAISSIVSSPLIDVSEIMSYYVSEVAKKLSHKGESVVLMLAQSQIRGKELFDKANKIMPPEVEILLSADRFYGTKNLVDWCQKAGWHYRIRLKGNLIFEHEGEEITAADIRRMPKASVIGACFNGSNIRTNIGYLHEQNHPEPWIIAMDCNPSKYRILDYAMRCGIECMFSDFKSRGFAITDTHITKVDRLEKLILILTIALY